MENQIIETIEKKGMLDISPGKEILLLLKRHGWDQIDLAYILGVSESTISNIVKDRTPISQGLAEVISSVFGMSPEYWLIRQMLYNQSKGSDRGYLLEIKKKSYLYKVFPVRELFAAGWITSTSGSSTIENEVQCLLGCDLYNDLYTKYHDQCLRDYQLLSLRNKMSELIWLCEVMRRIPDRRHKAFDLDRVNTIQESLYRYLVDANTFHVLLHDLEDAGVLIRVLPELTKRLLSGALIWDNGPVLVYAANEDTYYNFAKFLFVMLRVCTRYNQTEFGDKSTVLPDYATPLDTNTYNTQKGIKRLINLDCLIGRQPSSLVDFTRVDEVELSPGQDIPLLSFGSLLWRKILSPISLDDTLRITFPLEYSLRQNSKQGG